METKQIMLVCAAGMSTSLMVNKMQKAAEERGLAATIFAVPVSEAEDYLSEKRLMSCCWGLRYVICWRIYRKN